MTEDTAPYVYNVNKSKQLSLYNRAPLKLLLWPDKIVIEDKNSNTVFSCMFKDMKEAGYGPTYGWWFLANDGRKIRILTHGIYSFANWSIRKTDVNEKIESYLHATNVPKARNSFPIVKRKSDKHLNKILRLFNK